MLGNGRQKIDPPSSASLWGDMFGMGGFFKMISDPNLGAQAGAMMKAIIESSQAAHRTEAKLDALMKALGHVPIEPVAALSAPNGTDGSGRPASTGEPLDDGVGGAAHDG